MTTLQVTSSIGIFIIVGLIAAYYLLPSEAVKARRKKDKEQPDNPEARKWEETCRKLEKHILSLRGEIDKLKTAERKIARELEIEKIKCKKLQEKVLQEKQWLGKEEVELEKRDIELRDLKALLIKSQNETEGEHAAKLKLEQQTRILKQDFDSVSKEKFDATVRVQKLETELDVVKREVIRLKRANEELSKESDETNWIAKTEYEKVVKELREKQKELERVSRERA